MGTYGVYVWSAYGITALVLVINIIFSYRKQTKIKQQIKFRNESLS